MKRRLQGIICTTALLLTVIVRGQTGSGFSIPPGQQPLTPGEIPNTGTFYFLNGPDPGQFYAPLPCPPGDLSLPIYDLGGGFFLIDDSNYDWSQFNAVPAFTRMDDPAPQGGSGSVSQPCAALAQQVFSLIDTNDAAQDDTNLYNALLAFPADTNAGPDLQIMLYGRNSILIKANHFDYSADTRDFALVVCDSPSLPLWKTSTCPVHSPTRTAG